MRVHLRHTGVEMLQFKAHKTYFKRGYNLTIGRWCLCFRREPSPLPYRFFDLKFGREMLARQRIARGTR